MGRSLALRARVPCNRHQRKDLQDAHASRNRTFPTAHTDCVAARVFLAERDGYIDRLSEVASPACSRGGAIHDARIAAICLYHGVAELLSADRDFSRFASLRTRNPLTSA
jgi:predicted nucleic acid-binding protein